MPRIASILALVVIAAAIVVSAGAQSESRKPILHEDVRPPPEAQADNGNAQAGMLVGPSPTAGRNPSAIASGDNLLPEPTQDPAPNGQEPIHGGGGFAADRDTTWTPDRGTGQDGTLRYVEVFNPSIVPFKRMSAMDGIREDYTLFTRPSAFSDLSVGGTADPNGERFWGSLVIRIETGKEVPIPSVAPNMRILSYETSPSIAVTFSKDAADNFYIRSDEPGASGQYRLTFLAEAPSIYFAPVVDEHVRIRDIPRSMVAQLPPEIAASAKQAARQLAIYRGMRLKEALDRMTYYFRGFEAKSPPPASKDIFWDLFQSKAGVCRHRSFAFVVVAAAVGIPARYVTNEAHAWVEVWAPKSGWLRLDLGGAALNLEVSNASDKRMHQPRSEDPFSKPPNYLNNYSRLEGDVAGLTDNQLAEARQSAGPSGEGPLSDIASPQPGPEAHRIAPGPGTDLEEIPEEAIAGKAVTRVAITSVSNVGYRGETLVVVGKVQDDTGTGLDGLAIDVYLAPNGRDGDGALLVGQTVSQAQGRFETSVAIPGQIQPGRYQVFAGTPGNDTHQPSVSD